MGEGAKGESPYPLRKIPHAPSPNPYIECRVRTAHHIGWLFGLVPKFNLGTSEVNSYP